MASLLADVLEKNAFMVGDLVCSVTSQGDVVARQPVLINERSSMSSSFQVLCVHNVSA